MNSSTLAFQIIHPSFFLFLILYIFTKLFVFQYILIFYFPSQKSFVSGISFLSFSFILWLSIFLLNIVQFVWLSHVLVVSLRFNDNRKFMLFKYVLVSFLFIVDYRFNHCQGSFTIRHRYRVHSRTRLSPGVVSGPTVLGLRSPVSGRETDKYSNEL